MDRQAKQEVTDKESYQSTFRRALALAGHLPHEPEYSEEFQAALKAYFGDHVHHRRFNAWWQDHMGRRVGHALTVFCPWLTADVPLDDKIVLEIGCGTGSSTVALACQAGHVIACDIDAPSLEVAKLRLREDGWEDRVTFSQIDPELKALEKYDVEFDLVILYAVIEHMLPAERQRVFDIAWKVLKPGGYVIIYETPNRLFPFDTHTTQLWGWSLLPPEAALKYGKARKRFPVEETVEEMYREGYGSTYAELQALLSGKPHRILWTYRSERFMTRATVKLITSLFRIPRWAFVDYFALKIQKS